MELTILILCNIFMLSKIYFMKEKKVEFQRIEYMNPKIEIKAEFVKCGGCRGTGVGADCTPCGYCNGRGIYKF